MSENALALAGIDTTGLSEQEQAQLAAVYKEEMEVSRDGIDLQPIKFKINKDSCTFVDPFGASHEELKGAIVFKQKIRGYWNRESEENIPECSSQDGKTGVITETSVEQRCVSCPLNKWGSGEDESGQATKGKACKEMRRLFIILEGYHLPIMVSLPPTSIRSFDSYISARVTRGIPDIAAETIISLIPAGEGKRVYAVAKFKMGNTVDPKRMLELSRLRTSLQAAAEQITIENEDYMNSDAGTDEGEPF